MSIIDGLKQCLYELSSYIPDSGKKTIANIALAGTVAFTGVAYGCAKDEKPPVIEKYEVAAWAVEDENIGLKVNTFDDIGVKEVYIQFDGGEKIPLKKTYSEKKEGEKAVWESSFKLSPKDYVYSIIARDKVNEGKVESKIAVYPKDSVTGYALNKNLGIYLPQLLSLENNGVMDKNDQAFIDLVAKYPKAGELVPGLYAQFLMLPDLSVIDEKDIEAVEDILVLSSDPKYKSTFESMLNMGIKDKRKYCTPLEGLLWIAYDREFDRNNPLDDYSLKELINESWKKTTTSNNYKSEKWQKFDEVVARLNSPQLVTTYCIDNFPYDFTKINAYMATGRPQGIWSPQETFTEKKGACMDQSTFVFYCLNQGGYSRDNFSINNENGVCVFTAGPREFPAMHFTCLYTEGGNFYVIDVGTDLVRGIKGPLKTLEQAAETTYPRWGAYILFCEGKIVNR